MKRISILLAEDHMIVREGFRKILELDSDLELIGEAQDGRQAVLLAKKLRPDVLLMDIAMPHLNGLEATRQVLKFVPTTRVLILSAHSDDAYVEKAIDVGAVGFLLKQTSSHEVCRAIHEIAEGKKFFSGAFAQRLECPTATSTAESRRLKKVKHQLTSREMEVLQLIAEGNANKETAVVLGIGVKTVEKHREHLMEKLNIHDTAGLTRYAMSAGIIESGSQAIIRKD